LLQRGHSRLGNGTWDQILDWWKQEVEVKIFGLLGKFPCAGLFFLPFSKISVFSDIGVFGKHYLPLFYIIDLWTVREAMGFRPTSTVYPWGGLALAGYQVTPKLFCHSSPQQDRRENSWVKIKAV